MKTFLTLAAVCVCVLGGSAREALGQSEFMAWGNLRGIRVDGQLMAFGTRLCTIEADWSRHDQTAKERQQPRYSRNGNTQTVATLLGQLAFTQVVEDTGPGAATVDVKATANAFVSMAGAYLCIDLPPQDYADGSVQLIEPASAAAEVSLATVPQGPRNEYLRTAARGVRFTSASRQLEITFTAPTEVFIRDIGSPRSRRIRAYLTLIPGNAEQGRTVQHRFAFKVSGELDRNPVELALDPSSPGRVFDGLGGNFRLQNPETDPAVIQYNLANLRVAWGRVEVPWRSWHPDESTDPVQAAEAGKLDPAVAQAMEMARTLAQRNVPVIVSAWYPPAWAVGPPVPGKWGAALDTNKMDRIYGSLASYLIYLKKRYGVEAAMFSFNESDEGFYVRQTAEEHNALIKGLGAHLASKGLATTMLLGDTVDARSTAFIGPALNDPAARRYIGAVSFHSWRGWTDELLGFWRDAAQTLHVPLLVGEGSIDPSAWKYPAVFQEPSYALEEINLYTRILAIAGPRAILQWQLTADFSLLAGGGVFGDHQPLRPTQRFWNLKQLASTPAGAFALPVACGGTMVSCAAFGNIATGAYAVHIVNSGATRSATISGMPASVIRVRVYVTDSRRGMEEVATIPVSDGKAQFTLHATSFTSLMSVQ